MAQTGVTAFLLATALLIPIATAMSPQEQAASTSPNLKPPPTTSDFALSIGVQAHTEKEEDPHQKRVNSAPGCSGHAGSMADRILLSRTERERAKADA